MSDEERGIDERERLCAHIGAARDLVDALTALLSFCRAHAEQLSDTAQSRAGRARLARIVNGVRGELFSAYLTKSGKAYMLEMLAGDDYVKVARALAVGVDQVVRGKDSGHYRVMCASRGVRVLKDLDPYPTTDSQLAPMSSFRP